jgi:hypothetical protein
MLKFQMRIPLLTTQNTFQSYFILAKSEEKPVVALEITLCVFLNY